MTNGERAALKDIICYGTHCRDCAFYPACNWEEATNKTLTVLATKTIRCAKPTEKKTLMDYAKFTDVAKHLALKAKII